MGNYKGMEKSMTALPEIKQIENLPAFFPSDWQNVIFRNYGLVPAEKIAKVLNTDEAAITAAASDLGLSKIKFNGDWEKRGYITIIKNNWHILSYRQITQLLGISEDKLAFILKEDDFLEVKLGNFKPYLKEPVFYPLNTVQQKETKRIKEIVEANYIPLKKQAFDFFGTEGQNRKETDLNNGGQIIGDRIIYSYFALYGDSLSEGSCGSYPDYLLEKYAEQNINGIWMQGILYQLSDYPFDRNLSKGYEIRRKNLNGLIDRCAKYGIKVYLYLNEPRGMQGGFFEKNPDIKGESSGGYSSLCTSNEKVKAYLYNAVKELLTACPELGGIITITMSENLTHCYSRSRNCACACPECKKRDTEEVAAEVNNIIYSAVKDSGGKARLIANLWGWDGFMGWDIKRTKRGISLLDKNIDIMCISENLMEINKGGIKSKVIDYSISNPGPSDRSKKLLKYAKSSGHNIFAKVQINNSWECCAVPYIPVFGLIDRHINNLKKLGINGLMLSWTLGGYPGGSLSLASNYYGKDNFDIDKWYLKTYGEDYPAVKKAAGLFSKAFEEFPFDLDFLYNGPQNLGCANLWYLKKTGLKATMVGFPYDDIDGWRGVFSRDVLISQLGKMAVIWKKGLKTLEKANCGNKDINELYNVASACYSHFNSSYIQGKFIINKEIYQITKDEKTKQEMIKLIDEELMNVKLLYKAVSENACIGYEASNHYYYNENSLLEKIINLDCLKGQLS